MLAVQVRSSGQGRFGLQAVVFGPLAPNTRHVQVVGVLPDAMLDEPWPTPALSNA